MKTKEIVDKWVDKAVKNNDFVRLDGETLLENYGTLIACETERATHKDTAEQIFELLEKEIGIEMDWADLEEIKKEYFEKEVQKKRLGGSYGKEEIRIIKEPKQAHKIA
jgi:hypothetical protein